MSFDLYVFPAGGPATEQECQQVLTELEQLPGTGQQPGAAAPPPEPGMAAFISDLGQQYPWDEDNWDNVPWASWPLWEPVGSGGTALHVRWPFAGTMAEEICLAALDYGLLVYDPQAGTVFNPQPGEAVT